MDLSSEQLRFLRSQRIPLSVMFDASGMQRSVYKAAMENLDLRYAFGVSQCRNGHESIRTKNGHCIQCNTAWIAFEKRFTAAAWVYVAVSAKAGLVKIGLSGDLNDRIGKIKEYAYGGATDWELVCYAYVPEAGRVEFAAQERIAEHRISASYQREGRAQQCREVFRCNVALAVESLQAAVPLGTKVHALR